MSAARPQAPASTSRWVTSRTRRGPTAFTSTPSARARVTKVAASGAPPSPEVGQRLQQLQAKLTTYAKLNLAFVTIAVICMGTARYW